jgi:hypothetical protein
MQKFITRKNLLILNVILAVTLALTGFFGIVWQILGAKETETAKVIDPGASDQTKAIKTRPQLVVYDIIKTNNLFVYKGPKETKTTAPTIYYDLTKVWTLTGILPYADGLHGTIKDGGEIDQVTKQPKYHDVKVGTILTSEIKGKSYNVEILEVTKEYVKYYRHDMEDRTVTERTFELKLW